MSLLDGLRFRMGTSPIHRIDPRAKFIMVITLFSASILFYELLPLMAIFLIQVPLLLLGKVAREWIRTLRGGAVLALIIFASNLISFYFFQGYILTTEMIELSLSLSLRFLSLMTSFSIFFLTTSPDELSLALERARVPYEFNFAFITAIRFVPVLADEAQSILDAQRARGLEVERGGPIARLRNYIPILLPLIVNSIRRSLELAEAMESRGFGASGRRTNLYELRMKGGDYLVLASSIIFLGASIYLKLSGFSTGPIFPSTRIL
ncbi:MAG: energy-coupling factor transporter transmembrane component T [Candidatus Bathyarchaeia archaeon]